MRKFLITMAIISLPLLTMANVSLDKKGKNRVCLVSGAPEVTITTSGKVTIKCLGNANCCIWKSEKNTTTKENGYFLVNPRPSGNGAEYCGTDLIQLDVNTFELTLIDCDDEN